MAMHWKVPVFKIPFRKEVFILVNAAYECLNPEEGLAALQPVIASNHFFIFISCHFCRGAKAEHGGSNALLEDLNHVKRGKEEISKKNGRKVLHSLQQQSPLSRVDVGRRDQMLTWRVKVG